MSIVKASNVGHNGWGAGPSGRQIPSRDAQMKGGDDADEFDDDFVLDEEAEMSLAQIEDVFQQTQRAQSQTQRLSQPFSQAASYNCASGATSKRARSPQDGLQSQAIRKHARRLEEAIEEETGRDSDRVAALSRQLAEKVAEAEMFKKQMYAKDGEVKMLRGNMNNTISQYTTMLKEREEAVAVQRAAAQQFKQANEALVNENRTLKSFRVIEANTNTSHHLWSSVSASVSRRRAQAAATSGRGSNVSASRDLSQSHSQSHAASVGLTTPTKRNRGYGNRNLGSPSTAGRGDDASPTSTHGRRSEARQGDTTGTTTKKAKFPGFVNSFAKPFVVEKPQLNIGDQAARKDVSAIPDDEIFLDHHDVGSSQQPAAQSSSQMFHEQVEKTPSQADGKQRVRSGWGDPQIRFLWAVKTYSQRQAFLASLILSHSTTEEIAGTEGAAAQPESGASRGRLSSTTTLHRLLHVSLPGDCPSWLREEYNLAANSLLMTMARGATMDADDRFEDLLETLPYENEKMGDEELASCHQLAQMEALDVIEQGLAEVLDGVATSLRFLMAIAFKVGDYERVCDVLSLVRTIAIHFPAVIRFLVNPLEAEREGDAQPDQISQGEQGGAADDDQTQDTQIDEDQTQHDVAASLRRRHKQRLELNLDHVLVGCVEFACSSAAESGATAVSAGIVNAAVGVLEVMVLETVHNDATSLQCTHRLRQIFHHPGTLASLLDSRRATPASIQRTLSVLTFACQHDTLWRTALACRPDVGVSQGRSAALAAVSSEETALFEIIAKLLVDGRLTMDAEWTHRIHSSVIVFVSQLALCHQAEAVPLILHSGPILAALVKCLQLDTDMIWNYEAAFLLGQSEEPRSLQELGQTVDRVSMDLHLMTRLFVSDVAEEQTLAKKLAMPENHLLLNGMRHYFIVALSRVAFASEPGWMMDESDGKDIAAADGEGGGDGEENDGGDGAKAREGSRVALNEANELATSLLEMVLSPDEIESCWEAMAEDEDDGEEGTEREMEAQGPDVL